ncbi:MAG TPA: glycoside hydrolase family 47 protein, partial [Candidatus Thermoplasmatota archaeon]|nr:glycoside hydrolase family 47 protein [Candidatus Thermoplasmatota archaeon]
QVFEAIIRVTGGLLSGYHATGDERLLSQAKDVTDRLMPAFEKSPTGMPYRFVNLRTGAVSGANNYLAEIGTCITEFGYLSQITGDSRYVDAAKKALKAVYDRRSAQNLVGTTINVETGQWVGPPVVSTINPPVDSFFEYLFEGAKFLGDRDLLTWFETLNGAIIAKQRVVVPAAAGTGADQNVWFTSNEYSTGVPESLVQSELAAFYAGLLAESGQVELGRAYHDAWKRVLDKGGFRILPEGVNPVQYQATSGTNWLRPEYVDAALLLWFVTNDTVYVDRAVEYYNNMKVTSRVENGYTVLLDVRTRPERQGDTTPAYWYSENMKYYYLMFGRPSRFDYADNYMTTEGNVLRGLLRP